MSDILSGSFSEFDPYDVIIHINQHLEDIEILKNKEKEEWFHKHREKGKLIGFWPFKKKVEISEEELNDWWSKGVTEWYFDSPKYYFWDRFDSTIKRFKDIISFCETAIEAGNNKINLSLNDALFAYHWK